MTKQFNPRSVFLTVRVEKETRNQFRDKAERFGTPSEVLRELVDAFIENRIKIQPPVTRKDGLFS
jgi:hypothetical protein